MAGLVIRRCGDPGRGYASVRLDGPGGTEVFLSAWPDPAADDADAQAASMYDNFRRALSDLDLSEQDLITEKTFAADLSQQCESIAAARRKAYEQEPPPWICLEQPPLYPGRLCEMQAYAMVSGEAITDLPAGASGRSVAAHGLRHVHIVNVTGGEPGDGTDFAHQALDMFERAAAALDAQGLSFRDVVRTWVYLREMDRDYGELNRRRTLFYKAQGVAPLPASTGIGGGVCPPDRLCGLDIYALAGDERPPLVAMHASTLNEATSYGSSFSRGVALTRHDRLLAYLSGTASIDERGEVVHVGDIEGQVNRTFVNIEALFDNHGLGLSDTVSAIVYLKRRDYYDTFLKVAAERGMPLDVPVAVVVADVCRPTWLCEIEAIAARAAE